MSSKKHPAANPFPQASAVKRRVCFSCFASTDGEKALAVDGNDMETEAPTDQETAIAKCWSCLGKAGRFLNEQVEGSSPVVVLWRSLDSTLLGARAATVAASSLQDSRTLYTPRDEREKEGLACLPGR